MKLEIRDRPAITLLFTDKKVKKHFCSYITSPDRGFFAYKYSTKFEKNDLEYINGWTVYQHFLEYMRMGINIDDNESKYRLYIQELNGNICDSYPNFIYTHVKITDQDLAKVAKFRTKNRLPVLVWFSKTNKASLWRSAQSKSGLGKRNSNDETLLALLSNDTEKLHIYDARPYINALANKMKGCGFENTDNYKNSKIIFCDIGNIHVVRASYDRVRLIAQLPLYLRSLKI